jgi:hypothetical protein
MGAALLHTPVADWRFSEHARITATKFMLQGLREQKNPVISEYLGINVFSQWDVLAATMSCQ